MIRRTFQHVPGVGSWRERDLWARGITTWDEFPAAGARPVLSRRLDECARARIGEARAALAARELGKLGALVPAREHWRLYAEFEREAAFFDVEADGVSVHVPTVVSLYDANGLHAFIRGRNLDQLPERIAASRLWISFNGSCFDLPVLRSYFGSFPEPELHVDLRFLCRRVGWSGGLKQIEEALGIARPTHLRGVGGLQAVALWRSFERVGELEALRFLVEYNLYDSFQLRSVASRGYNRAVDLLACDEPKVPVFDRGELLYDLSKLLLEIGPSAP
ncbi:MAG TPA: ribonuclease H-like domain-containing protein [Myxococcaceae bacterium]|nr:ribonuclease H-like domain-containing protein [Myxococcaceae bacterium]